ncbi:T-cell surface glycoprotein CD3 epsilon chain-like [Chaetodon trifascialis]|uniref:T-cell surface glycoprotein CD3 epsilon chain-like n=1 Tax=Chaetodon trifascialis TaxID=109706 RepID=UPI0039965680
MKCQKLLPASLLLLWTLTASVSCNDAATPKIQAKTVSGGIVLTCDGNKIKNKTGDPEESLRLAYSDDNTGEYECVNDPATDGSDEGQLGSTLPKIFVKFRTCDNCIELDLTSVMAMAVGNVVATVGIGVAVYLLMSHTRISPTASHKKSSDRQHLVPNEVSSRAPNDHYQPLKHKGGQRDTYDVLTNRR